jgi:CHAD domain-containing protein
MNQLMAREPIDRNEKISRLYLIEKDGDGGRRSDVPPHLATVSWIDHETNTALLAFKDLRKDLKELKKKVSAARVHRSRVTLRRWASIWSVLRKDGWETEKFNRQVGKPLRRLQKLLGGLRDLDVNIEQGERLGCTQEQFNVWMKDHSRAQEKLEKFVDRKDITKILKRLEEFLKKHGEKVQQLLPRAKAEQSAFDHIEFFLLKQESITREQAESAHTPEEFHQLRLSIKRWRYLLTEFFGVTNLELVRAQQILGQMHDLDRLTPILLHADNEEAALAKLKTRRKELLSEIEQMRRRLPYGLRPEVTSSKKDFASDSAR